MDLDDLIEEIVGPDSGNPSLGSAKAQTDINAAAANITYSDKPYKAAPA